MLHKRSRPRYRRRMHVPRWLPAAIRTCSERRHRARVDRAGRQILVSPNLRAFVFLQVVLRVFAFAAQLAPNPRSKLAGATQPAPKTQFATNIRDHVLEVVDVPTAHPAGPGQESVQTRARIQSLRRIVAIETISQLEQLPVTRPEIVGFY